jgi:stalled ribosome rescue protein Dom34
MSYRYTAVWIDQQQARVLHVEAETFTESIIHAPQHLPRHPQREAPVHNHPDDEGRFFDEVTQSLRGANQVLVVGPSQTKLHFRDYVKAHAATLSFGIAGVETIDHPTDKQLAAYVRQYFLSPGQVRIHPH